LGAFSLPIWRQFKFWHLSDAKRVSQIFGMTHEVSITGQTTKRERKDNRE
jgi:hypothetical protein